MQRIVSLFVAGLLTGLTIWLLIKGVAFVGPRFDALPPSYQTYARMACYLLMALPGVIMAMRYRRRLADGEAAEATADD